eukprot:TRINITY_DN44663_c0_g1_i2.p2 TRINITY_DN44663_c0_g1~~TRINITY_DN44663_c0_g1_i2.p2  ORF type:complete len:101 (-),score=36.47 TRINITY_DN44663_c0_g1_i2:403-705(-)
MIRRPPRSTLSSSSAASDVYKRQELEQQLAGSELQLQQSTDHHIAKVLRMEEIIHGLNAQVAELEQKLVAARTASEQDKNLVLTMSHAMDTLSGLQRCPD